MKKLVTRRLRVQEVRRSGGSRKIRAGDGVGAFFGGSITEVRREGHLVHVKLAHVGGETTCFFNTANDKKFALLREGAYASVEVVLEIATKEEGQARIKRLEEELAKARTELAAAFPE